MNGNQKAKLKKNKCCVYCGCNEPLALTIDHKTPKIRGGLDNPGNLHVCCWICNQVKGNLNHSEFLKYRKSLHLIHELAKVRLQFPPNLPLIFKPYHYPDYKWPDQKPKEEPIK